MMHHSHMSGPSERPLQARAIIWLSLTLKKTPPSLSPRWIKAYLNQAMDWKNWFHWLESHFLRARIVQQPSQELLLRLQLLPNHPWICRRIKTPPKMSMTLILRGKYFMFNKRSFSFWICVTIKNQYKKNDVAHSAVRHFHFEPNYMFGLARQFNLRNILA